MRKLFFTAETRRRGVCWSGLRSAIGILPFLLVSLCLGVSAVNILAQEIIPAPGAAKPVTIPAVKESKLKNGLTVAVVEKRSVPIVTVQLLVKAGASSEDIQTAGLANMTAAMLTKGTKTRSAEQIAEEIEFLGASISSGAGWNSSSVAIGVTSDKLNQALAIMADVVLNPSFKQEELDLLTAQSLDELKYNLTQPAFLANYTASSFAFHEHPTGGTAVSLARIRRINIGDFHKEHFDPANSVLIFTGDITQARANTLARNFFGAWKPAKLTRDLVLLEAPTILADTTARPSTLPTHIVKRLVVIDMPKSGQASVNFYKPIYEGRSIGEATSRIYYPASVMNSLLGGGYSSRLNQEIRIKRGLSYGAGSSFSWRDSTGNFSTRTQTKNETAAQVAELVLAEIKRLTDSPIPAVELTPRKSVLTGGFGRNLETTAGLAAAIGDLYSFGIPTGELNRYVSKVNAVSDVEIREFSKRNLLGGDIIIVGDYSIFKDDLAKRFPNMSIEVIRADELDITRPNLRK